MNTYHDPSLFTISMDAFYIQEKRCYIWKITATSHIIDVSINSKNIWEATAQLG